MTNQALPQKSRQLLEHYMDRCQNLGLILDKFAPWGNDGRGGWDLVMQSTVRSKGQNEVRTLTGGEAKGLWLSTSRNALKGESPSLFEVNRTDPDLMRAWQQRWREMVENSGGIAFTMMTAERLVAGLGASHVLETALTLDRNTGLPYLPGSTVKGLARAWGLIEVAAHLGVKLDNEVMIRQEKQALLNVLTEKLISAPDNSSLAPNKKSLDEELRDLRLYPASKEAEKLVWWFRFIFGWQEEAGAVCFIDAIYAGEREPKYAADVMTPHYVNYYTENGGKPPAEDDNPNPVSFITIDRGNNFAFALVPRASAFPLDAEEQKATPTTALNVAAGWLQKALTQLGAGSKTASGYGFFSQKSLNSIVNR